MSDLWTTPDSRRLHAMHHPPSNAEAARFRLGTLLWFAGITLLLVPMATLLDIPIAKWFAQDPLPDWAGWLLEGLLYYAHGTGITCILVGLLFFAPTKRWHIPRLAVLAAGGGAISTLTKMFVLRPRPNSLLLTSANNDHAWIWNFDWTLSHVADFEPSSRAFPSAYLATATALTVGLWTLYPRAKWLFSTLCFGTLMQRLLCGSHFMSDLFGSAAIGLWWSYVCYHPSLMGSLFEKLESDYQSASRLASSLSEPSTDMSMMKSVGTGEPRFISSRFGSQSENNQPSNETPDRRLDSMSSSDRERLESSPSRRAA
jgi:membrane-associated phospholipid phosphatase